MRFSSPRWQFVVAGEFWNAVQNDAPILKHTGTKENGKNVRIKAIWHAAEESVSLSQVKLVAQMYIDLILNYAKGEYRPSGEVLDNGLGGTLAIHGTGDDAASIAGPLTAGEEPLDRYMLQCLWISGNPHR